LLIIFCPEFIPTSGKLGLQALTVRYGRDLTSRISVHYHDAMTPLFVSSGSELN